MTYSAWAPPSAGLALTFTTPLARIAALGGAGWLPLLGAVAVRWYAAVRMPHWAGDPGLRRWLWLPPVRSARPRDLVRRAGRPARALAWPYLHDHRWRRGIFEFTDDPACVLRLAIARDDAGDRIGELQLWNEQLPATAFALDRRLNQSLVLLARFVASRPPSLPITGARGWRARGSRRAGRRTRRACA